MRRPLHRLTKLIKNPLVTIVIATRNSSRFLENCLLSISSQTYPYIEIILVDGKSNDNTVKIARRYKCRIFAFVPRLKSGLFDATQKRNYGVKKAKGRYIYYFDADMEMTRTVVAEAVMACEKDFHAVIIPEDSFGEGIWARAKNLERRCYWGDDLVEAPRFFRKEVWSSLGGLDENIAAGGDDWDLYQKALEEGYKVGRIKSLVYHNEGRLKLIDIFRKQFIYRKDTLKYIIKRPKAGLKSYFPLRWSYIRNWKMFLSRPVDTTFFLIMRSGECVAAILGIFSSLLKL